MIEREPHHAVIDHGASLRANVIARRSPSSAANSSTMSFLTDWDPLGIAPPATPGGTPSNSEHAALQRSVEAFIADAQSLPMLVGRRVSRKTAASLGASLEQCLDEWRDESETAQRELEGLRRTVALQQSEARAKAAAAAARRAAVVPYVGAQLGGGRRLFLVSTRSGRFFCVKHMV